MASSYLKYLGFFVGVMFLQFVFTNNFILFGVGFNFVYIAFILLLPVEISAMLLLLLAFLTGLSVDVMGNTLGIHASASVFIAFMRTYILKLFTPRGGYDQGFKLNLFYTGWQWFFSYVFVSAFLHHLFLFVFENLNSSYWIEAIIKAFFSAIIFLFMVLMGQLLFADRR
jgi:hypothetical protein